MEAVKQGLYQKIEEKGTSVPAVAEAIGFDKDILKLYFASDAFPVPKRIIDKISAHLAA